MPAKGHKAYMQFGRESVYGTGVAATNRLEIISHSIAPVVGVIRDPSLNDQASRRGLYQGGILYRGSIVTRFNYSGMLHLFDALFGTATFGNKGAGTTGAGDPYTHSFKEKALLNSYTIEIVDDAEGDGKCIEYNGCKVVGATFRSSAGTGEDAMLQVEWNIIAKTATSATTPTGALSAPAVEPALFHETTIVDDGVNTTGVKLRSFEVSLQNPVHEDRFYHGAVNIDEPIRSDFVVPTMRLTYEWNDYGVFDVAEAFTEGSPEIRFGDGGSPEHFIRFQMDEAKPTEFNAPVGGYGIQVATAGWEAFRSSGNANDSALWIEIVNGEAGGVF